MTQAAGGHRRLLLFGAILGLVLLVVGGVVVWVAHELPRWEAERAAMDAIEAFRQTEREDGDIIDLEDQLVPLGDPAIAVLAREVERTGSVALFKIFDGLAPEVGIPYVARLRDHDSPEIRHGSLFALAQYDLVTEEEWRVLLADAGEDRFIRHLAAQQLALNGRWWAELEVDPEATDVEGVAERRVTILRPEISFGDLCGELAWVTGGESQCPPAVADATLERVFYFHVPLGLMLRDLHTASRYGIYHFRLDGRNVVVERRHQSRNE